MRAHRKSSLGALIGLIYPCSAADLSHYKHFFADKQQPLLDLVNGNCSAAYETFVQGIPSNVVSKRHAFWDESDSAWVLIDCLLDATPESVKAKFSSAQIVLGLMPSILSVLGPSSQELSMLLVLGDRPLLAACLALGSPFLNHDHSFDYAQHIKALPRRDQDNPLLFPKWQAGIPLLCFQYLMTFAAIANIAELSYEFALKASSMIVQSSLFLPGTLAIIGFVVHLMVAFVFYLRVEIKDRPASKGDDYAPWHPGRLTRWTCRQVGATKMSGTKVFELLPPGAVCVVLSWFTKAWIFGQVAFSIATFSTILFVSHEDAAVIFFRYFASILVCRMIAENEIAVLGLTVNREEKSQRSQPFDRASRESRASDHEMPLITRSTAPY